MIASEMPAAIKPYSIAVAPDSSDKKFKTVRFNSTSAGGCDASSASTELSGHHLRASKRRLRILCEREKTWVTPVALAARPLFGKDRRRGKAVDKEAWYREQAELAHRRADEARAPEAKEAWRVVAQNYKELAAYAARQKEYDAKL